LSALTGDTPLDHVVSHFYEDHMTRNDYFGVISGHMTTIKITGNMAMWGIPRKSTKNAAQGKKLECKIFIQTREMTKKPFLNIFTF
jgi:hypothetical protein